MNWRHKALIVRICSTLPLGDSLYQLIQKRFGRLTGDPTLRLPTSIEMARWILDQGLEIEGRTFFEVGTGHKPILPIGLFLLGAGSVITVDLHRRLDLGLTKQVLLWMIQNQDTIEAMYGQIVGSVSLRKRLSLIAQTYPEPQRFLKEAGIRYLAPANATRTDLPTNSINYHFSVTVLEHIPLDVIRAILVEARRILTPDGLAIHFINLSDHFSHEDGSISKVNFLQFSELEWLRLAGNQFAYCNRLRASDFLAIFQQLNFNVFRHEIDPGFDSHRQAVLG